MENQIQTIFQFPGRVYAEGGPIVIDSGVVQLDVAANRIFSIFQIRNTSDKIIESCKIKIWANDANGAPLQGVEEYVYGNVNAVKEKVFGYNTPILLPDVNTKTITVIVSEVIFTDGTVWDGSVAQWGYVPEKRASQPQNVQSSAGGNTVAGKPAKGKKKAIAIVGVLAALFAAFILVVGVLAVLVPFVIVPTVKNMTAYSNAQQLLEAGSYDEAYEAFEELGDYKDSSEMALEAIYRKAEYYYDEGYFERAIDLWSSIPSYKDSTDRIDIAWDAITERNYNNALDDLALGYYLSAIDAFGALGDYKDSAERYKESVYYYALTLMADEEYAMAIDYFAMCPDYMDASERTDDAKYGYVLSHKDSSDSITYEYINDLVNSGYSGAKNLYNEIYEWKVTITCVNDSVDGTNNMTSVSNKGKVVFHYKVSGGTPGSKAKFKIQGDLPRCQTLYYTQDVYDGYSGYYYMYYTSGSGTGTAYFRIYDENNKLLASASVYVY